MKFFLLGDSLSASDSSPGGILARKLGASKDALSGRSAYHFVTADDGINVLDRELAAAQPDIVVIFLGTNDVGLGVAPVTKAYQELRAVVEKHGARAIHIGPPLCRSDVSVSGRSRNDVAQVIDAIGKQVFGVSNFIDARVLSNDLINADQRTADGVHFLGSSARVLGERLYNAVVLRLQGSSGPSAGRQLAAGLLVLGLIVLGVVCLDRYERR